MFPFTGVTLGVVVFGIGVMIHYLSRIGKPGQPMLIHMLVVGVWVALGFLANTIGKSSVTISLMIIVGTVALGVVAEGLLNRLGWWWLSRRGSRMYKQVMKEREAKTNGKHWRWQQQP